MSRKKVKKRVYFWWIILGILYWISSIYFASYIDEFLGVICFLLASIFYLIEKKGDV